MFHLVAQIERSVRLLNQCVCTENLIRVDDVMESPKLAEYRAALPLGTLSPENAACPNIPARTRGERVCTVAGRSRRRTVGRTGLVVKHRPVGSRCARRTLCHFAWHHRDTRRVFPRVIPIAAGLDDDRSDGGGSQHCLDLALVSGCMGLSGRSALAEGVGPPPGERGQIRNDRHNIFFGQVRDNVRHQRTPRPRG
jgi:hypothetical protein